MRKKTALTNYKSLNSIWKETFQCLPFKNTQHYKVLHNTDKNKITFNEVNMKYKYKKIP